MLLPLSALLLSAAPVQTFDALVQRVKDDYVAASSDAASLGKDGRYEQAAARLEGFAKSSQGLLAGAAPSELERVGLGKKHQKYVADGIAIHRRRATWSKTQDLASVRALVVDLFDPGNPVHGDVGEAMVSDRQVQLLLAAARKLDPRAAALFGPRKVKVVVEGVAAPQNAGYAKLAAAELSALGLKASPDAGAEEFRVSLKPGTPVPAHAVGAEVNECTLEAKATWKAAAMTDLDLTTHGLGDEGDPPDCINQRLTQSAQWVAVRVLLAWAAQK